MPKKNLLGIHLIKHIREQRGIENVRKTLDETWTLGVQTRARYHTISTSSYL